MTGNDICRARKAAGVSQGQLADALGLQGGRGGLTDVENGNIEVTTAWALKAIAAIQGIATEKQSQNKPAA